MAGEAQNKPKLAFEQSTHGCCRAGKVLCDWIRRGILDIHAVAVLVFVAFLIGFGLDDVHLPTLVV
jgi:hypothetical protein